MPARMIVDLGDGNIVLFGGAPEPGVADAGLANGAARATPEVLKTAMGSLGEIASALDAAIGGLASRPHKVEIEFGATLSQDGDLWIVSAGAASEFKVRLAWDKSA